MAAVESTPKPRAARPRAVKVGECAPACYSVSTGVLSFRQGLRVRERNAIDKALAIVGRCLALGRAVFKTHGAVKTYLQLQLGGEKSERFGVMFLDAQNRLIAFEILAIGTLTQASVYPREIALATLAHGAASVVLSHNHPSGTVQPSRADEMLTQHLKTTLALIDVRVLDHVIVTSTDALSLAERGLM